MSIPRAATPPPPTASDLLLPRILCLHGGGTNSRIFRAQLRSFTSHATLAARFRFVYCEAPFDCDEGIGVYPVYAAWGPFKRWSRWLPSHPTIDANECQRLINDAIATSIAEDDRLGGTGPWTAVLGFSQGAKVACSMLWKQQLEHAKHQTSTPTSSPNPISWRFGVIMAGRAPILALTPEMESKTYLQSAAGLPDEADMDDIFDEPEHKLRIPTVHVHGLRDEGLHLHRRCVEDYCAAGTTTVVEWDGPHRVPIKKSDVDKVVAAIMEVADEYGV